MKPLVSQRDTALLYVSGMEALLEQAEALNDVDWLAVCCGNWRAADVARHLVGVIGWYETWLDRAIAGNADVPFPRSDLDRRAGLALEEQGELGGPAAMKVFVERATAYLDRAKSAWDLPYGYPLGTITTGLHVGVAAAEWHLHAWDLSGVRLAHGGVRHVPDRVPEESRLLYLAAGDALAAPKSGPVRWGTRQVVRLTSSTHPWVTLRKEAGRTQVP